MFRRALAGPQTTAREINEISDMPRTWVYDAIDIPETKGVVTVQYTNPQVFRAVGISEAIDTPRRTDESRLRSVEAALESIAPATLKETTAAAGDRERAVCAAGETDGVVVFGHHLLTPINH